jgi:type I restriction enzyme, S subunit
MSETALTPKLRFPKFSGEWEEKKLGDFFDITSSKRVFQDEWTSSGVPFYRAREIVKLYENGYVNNELFITEEMYEDYKTRYGAPVKDDLMVSGVGTLGKLYVVKDRDRFYFKDGNIVWFKTLKLISSKFVAHLFNTREVKKQISDNATVSTVGTFTIDSAKKTKVVIPPLPEQQKIASFLTSVDSKIEQLSKKKELHSEYKKGLMQKIFSQDIRFKADDGSDYPDWEEKKLGDVATFSKGKGISKSDIDDDGKFECIRYGELFTEYNEVINKVKSKTNCNENMIYSKDNDMLMPTSDVTPYGLSTASALIRSGIILGGDILIIRSNYLFNHFFSYFVSNNKKEIIRLVSGTTVFHIYAKDLKILKINLPSLSEQTKIANFLSSIDSKIEQIDKQLDETKQFKKALLQQMFV